MKYGGAVLATVAVSSLLFTLFGGVVGYEHYMEESPVVQQHGGYRSLNFGERFDYFAWEASLDALPFAVLLSIGVALPALPTTLLLARRRGHLAYPCSGLAGAILGGLLTWLAAYFVFDRWPQPTLNVDWACALAGGAFCAILLAALVRRWTRPSYAPGPSN